ncbi:RNA-directed DNA polymerase [Pseudofrankia sp. BMG5.37]|uniref:RNA-directed DNA polymerase n=1 Tax=Pseudofrankia sp. BMG5.37 TaxID=3050035 RepID=UPI00289411F1|nr:RNA-directed DNA polymerase [Pseudofrankia sp. BMG5.37]MDT3443146.1 RNA-directed DNA polymerase [Pseudofrankia sp. BMG5.37]
MGRQDAKDSLDIKFAAATAKNEQYGDWFRDPWGWPELSYLANHPDLVVSRISDSARVFELLDVPKHNFGTRPAVVMCPADRMIYHALVNRISAKICAEMSGFVFGWRLPRPPDKSSHYLNNGQEWLELIARRREYADDCGAVLSTDVTNFFASIPPQGLVDRLHDEVGSSDVLDYLEVFLETYRRTPARTGIPQRSLASALLANCYIRPVDDVLRGFQNRRGIKALRWMDDIWAFCPDPDVAREIQLDIQRELRSIELEINLGKTRVVEGPGVQDFLADHELEREEPTVQVAPSGSRYVSNGSVEDLDRAANRLISEPENADRTMIRYVCSRIVGLEQWHWIPRILEVVPRSLHGADHYSRMIRTSGRSRELESWYLDLTQSSIVNRLPWAQAQLALMFPQNSKFPKVSEFLLRRLEGSVSDLDLVTTAGRLVAAWDRDNAISVLRQLGERPGTPLVARSLALTLHSLSRDRKRVRSLLGAYRETEATLRMLEDGNFKPLKETKDFAGA